MPIKENNLNEINYHIGIDSDVSHFAIYDLKIDGLEILDSKLTALIDGRVIMKGLKAIRNNEFLESISWEG